MGFDEKILLERIKSDNIWWENNQIPFYEDLSKRRYFNGFYDLVSQEFPHRAVVLMGPRRIGKTVMMYQAIQDLIHVGVKSSKIFYFSLDTPIYTNIGLEELISKGLSVNSMNFEGCYIFFDEIQYLKDWEVHLKSLVDKYRKTKFIASGSAAAALRMKSIESGAGRFTDYFLPPLTFAEYIDLNRYNTSLSEIEVNFKGSQKFYNTSDIDSFNKHFVDYINFGGFPEIALNSDKVKNPERIIQKDITDKVIMKDLPGLFGIENTLELQQFFNVLSYRTGEILDYKGVSRETNTDNKTIKKYIKYLEAAFLIKILHRVDVTAKRFKNITQFKVYLTNPSLYTGLFGKIAADDERFPHLVETTVYAQYLHREHEFLRYANWKKGTNEGEVDLIQISANFQKVYWALEVKWSDNPRPGKLEYFMKKNKLDKGIITSKTKFQDLSNLLIVPNSIYAYVVGKNALDRLDSEVVN
ncbi:ATPase (AAA+ superfamily) [Fulvivirga imtechensis AK7]|uniref:ATPase (AAA+ superfamily) n=1 Tax=Fulvivirga imtechensis AK7 TaxID=1237149 RepID=L8JS32_9BACT|nr:ATP-binding protein [Fulvivirga imtechensis]ELR70182.1 ATPase (AAA+ superfamily) [Fulvivirga imtechensis AK7]